MKEVGCDFFFGDEGPVDAHSFAEGGYVGRDEEADGVTCQFERFCNFEAYGSLAVGSSYVNNGDFVLFSLAFFLAFKWVVKCLVELCNVEESPFNVGNEIYFAKKLLVFCQLQGYWYC